MKEDFVKVSISVDENKENILHSIFNIFGEKTFEEFHAYPVRNDARGEAPLPPKADQLNIVFLLVDSVSHSAAERYLKKTLKKMKQSPSTVILNVSNRESSS